MAKHDQEETIHVSKSELSAMVAEAAGIAVKGAMAAQAAIPLTPKQREADANERTAERVRSLRPEADLERVRTIACLDTNGARFDAIQARRSDGQWRTVRLDNYREPADVLERLQALGVEPQIHEDTGRLDPLTKHEIAVRYWIYHINRYVANREPLPVDHEEMARRAPVAAE